MVNNRLMWYLESNHILNPSQNGFRRNRNCLDHVIKLDTHVREAFIRNYHSIAIFFDMEKAYDTTWRYGILRDLHASGLRGHLPMFIKNFLHLRSFKVRVGKTYSDSFIQQLGVPQGSILSPTLFILKINKTLPSNIKCSLYVDDYAIYSSGPCLQTLEKHLQDYLNTLSKWTDSNGFKISKEKTVLIHFNNSNNSFLRPNLQY